MPPKGKDAKAQDKAKLAQKAKAVEDKTFGLKNKNKSTKVQKQVEAMTKQVKQQQQKLQTEKTAVKDKKKLEEEKAKELAALFAVAIKQPKVPPGVDPKSIVCEFFRHGQCTKGFKCKFAHDLSVERKGVKIDLFTDQRDVNEGMEDWDQDTLEKVVNEKHGNEKPANQTNIICKFFLEAVEKKQYGWFWKCPNGGECKYRHALPPGYVLKSQMKELLEEEARNRKDIAEEIEEERAKVDAKTPITETVFREWRQKKIDEKKKQKEEQDAERKKKGILSGREMFMQEGFQAMDDGSAADDYAREDDEEQRISEMFARADAAARAAREEASKGEAGDNSACTAAPISSTTAAGTTLQLNADDAALFLDDDDDDDEQCPSDDELEDDGDGGSGAGGECEQVEENGKDLEGQEEAEEEGETSGTA